jgi:hypothetical protein
MVVLALHGGGCAEYDAGDARRVATLGAALWVPLPAAIPERPSARLEHARGSPVLAMWNPTGRVEDWTAEFHPATVVSRPCGRPGEPVRGYVLEFWGESAVDGRRRIVVPEHFVAADPEAWPPDDL